jgi:hypothetical protein
MYDVVVVACHLDRFRVRACIHVHVVRSDFDRTQPTPILSDISTF